MPRASYHQTCTGIAGSRGVRFSSPTEPDVEDWFGSKMWNGDGPKTSPAVWDRDGFIGGSDLLDFRTVGNKWRIVHGWIRDRLQD